MSLKIYILPFTIASQCKTGSNPIIELLIYMGITGCYFGISMAESILNYAQVFGLLVEICSTAMAEDVACLTGLFKTGNFQGFVHDVAQSVAGNTPQFVVVRV